MAKKNKKSSKKKTAQAEDHGHAEHTPAHYIKVWFILVGLLVP